MFYHSLTKLRFIFLYKTLQLGTRSYNSSSESSTKRAAIVLQRLMEMRMVRALFAAKQRFYQMRMLRLLFARSYLQVNQPIKIEHTHEVNDNIRFPKACCISCNVKTFKSFFTKVSFVSRKGILIYI